MFSIKGMSRAMLYQKEEVSEVSEEGSLLLNCNFNASYIDNKSLTFLVENKYPIQEPHKEVKLLQHYNKTLYYIKWVSNIVERTKYCVY